MIWTGLRAVATKRSSRNALVALRAVAALAAAAFAVNQLTYLPYAAPLVGETQTRWTVSNGYKLALDGPQSADIFNITGRGGDGVTLEAQAAHIDGDADKRPHILAWVVDKPAAHAPDNHFQITIKLPRGDPRASIEIQRVDEEDARHVVIRNHGTPLLVGVGFVVGPSLTFPPTKLTVDQVDRPMTMQQQLKLGLRIDPGGQLGLTFPRKAAGDPADGVMRILTGTNEDVGSRLQLDRVALYPEDGKRPTLQACAAVSGDYLWHTLLPWSPDIARGDCHARDTLEASSLLIDDDRLAIDLIGSAYYVDAIASEQSTSARWMKWIGGNPVTALILGAAYAALTGWALTSIKAMWPAPNPSRRRPNTAAKRRTRD